MSGSILIDVYRYFYYALTQHVHFAAEMSSARLYVGRLSDSAKDRDVERFFKGYGRIREIVLKNGYGFVVCIEFS